MILCDLLDASIKIRDQGYSYIDDVEDVLKAIDAYLIKHPKNYTDEQERFYATIKKIPAGKYDLYLNKIKNRLELM